MLWLKTLVEAIWFTTNIYSWYLSDPASQYALVQVGCVFPTLRCIQQAQVVAVELATKQVEHYWSIVNEENARAEHERKTQEAHDQYILQQLAKGDKWDRWEVSPPTIINQHFTRNISPTINNFIGPTFVSKCTPLSEVTGSDVVTIATRDHPTLDAPLRVPEYSGETLEVAISIWAKQSLFLLVFVTVVWKMFAIFWRTLTRCFGHRSLPAPSGPSPPPARPAPPSTTGMCHHQDTLSMY